MKLFAKFFGCKYWNIVTTNNFQDEKVALLD